MTNRIGIRREDKNRWERRAPLAPEHVRRLVNDQGVDICIQSSDLRIFPEEDYESAGARIVDDLDECDVIMGVKEVSVPEIRKDKVYMFFSHTIKGQPHNMKMLKRLKEKKVTLIDYEKIVDEKGRRLIFFGWHAGVSGMIDSLWALGMRLEWEGVRNPLSSIMPTREYGSLKAAREHMAQVGRVIATYGIPYSIRPMVIGITGEGNVSMGAQEILDLLPIKEISPRELPYMKKKGDFSNNIYKVVFSEEDMVEPVEENREFDLQEYYDHPERYRSKFHKYVPYLTMLINSIYWDQRYPRLLTKSQIKKLYTDIRSPKLRVIGDISCDIEGAIEATVKSTTPESPTFIYDPWEDDPVAGWKGTGPVIMAVDNLPCELPGAASVYFGDNLKEFIPPIAETDFSANFKDLDLPKPVKSGIILHKGKFTRDFRYMEDFIKG